MLFLENKGALQMLSKIFLKNIWIQKCVYISQRRKFKREWGERKSSERMMRDKLKRESEKKEWE